jgi:hypothetical protein
MTERSPLVPVVIPTYNCARWLSDAVDSVLVQTYRNFEIIVVGDGSTDNTQDVLARYGDRIRVIRQANARRGAARNAGILAAQGEYIAFLDADDLWLPRKLERQMPVLRARPELGWVYSDYCRFDESGRHQVSVLERAGLQPPPQGRGQVLRTLLTTYVNVVSVITVVVRAKCFRDVGLYDSSTPVVENWSMWLWLASRFEVRCVNGVLALYRRHPEQSTNGQHGELFAHCAWRTFREFAGEHCRQLPSDGRAEAYGIARRRLAEHACGVAEAALSRGDRRAAGRWFLMAARAALGTSVYSAELAVWSLGRLLDICLPRPVMRSVRFMKRSAARVRRARIRNSESPSVQDGQAQS